jgi:hypothetical protein
MQSGACSRAGLIGQGGDHGRVGSIGDPEPPLDKEKEGNVKKKEEGNTGKEIQEIQENGLNG